MSARDRMTPEQRANLAEQLGDAQPARTELLVSFGESVRNRAEHDHKTQREDWYCLNLSSYMGERIAPVLRRLINAESDADRYRTAWRLARTRALSTGGAADRYAARARELQIALQDSLVAVIGTQIERDAIRTEALREAADWLASVGETNAAYLLRTCDVPTAEQGEKDTREGESTPQPAELTIYRASHESIVMGHYTTREAAREHCEALQRRELAEGAFLGWVPDDGSDKAPEELSVFGPGHDDDGPDEDCTGYVVTPLEVASEYDEEADE